MSAIPGPGQLVPGSPEDHFLSEVDEGLQHLAQAHQFRPPAIEGQHVDAEGGLQGREAIELVQHDVGRGVALELDDDPHALTVALVAQVRHALNPLVTHEFRNPLDQDRLVHLIGDGGDDDRLALLADLLDGGRTAHHHGATSGHQGGPGGGSAHDLAAGREVGTRNDIQEFV